MLKIICGEKGKGKTKILLEKANDEVKTAEGNIVFLDKTNEHMCELVRDIRLINVKDFFIDSFEQFIGFICGIISQDNDLETLYLDNFLKLTCGNKYSLIEYFGNLDKIASKWNLDIIVSISVNQTEIPDEFQKDIIVAL
ncbi:MAG: twitching motility protein PilT [Lachnospiraceae bacterium]|nr:twitching motility protein PilT [Lachnospiraceae bacterium]